MATLREIRRRIRAVNNIQQITRAMYMVAATKLKRAELQARNSRSYAQKLRELMGRVAGAEMDFDHPLLASRPVKRVLLVQITSDRGLAGPLNSNINRLGHDVLKELQQKGLEPMVLPIGRKGREFFERLRAPLIPETVTLNENITFVDARRLARVATTAFSDGRVDEVRLLYTHFNSAVSQYPTQKVVLPIGEMLPDNTAESVDNKGFVVYNDYLLEPSAKVLMEQLLPRYIEIEFYRALVEAKASEQGSRMTAMKNATDNAEELVDDLTLSANRARQEQITKELAEIVGGAAAQRG